MAHSRIAILVIGVVLISQAAPVVATPTPEAAPSAIAAAPVCNGKYKGWLKPSAAELANILKKHAAWVKDGGWLDPKLANDPRRANLCGAYLRGVNLNGADLTGADLNGADLTGVDLKGAHLNGADLTGADLKGAHLNGADLRFANLRGGDLEFANLMGAHLESADLSSANLDNAQLHTAKLAFADVQYAHFDIFPDDFPDTKSLSLAYGLQLVRFSQFTPWVNLRDEFRNLGLRNQEKQVTSAIWRSVLQRKDPEGHYVHNWLERWVSYLLFDVTCQYGASSVQPAQLAMSLVMLFSVAYVLAQVVPSGRGGIWVVWDKDRIDKTEGTEDPIQTERGLHFL
jgi:Pentapeptide repeats (8 copies)